MYLFLYSAFYFYTKLDITKVLTCSLAILHGLQMPMLLPLPDGDGYWPSGTSALCRAILSCAGSLCMPDWSQDC